MPRTHALDKRLKEAAMKGKMPKHHSHSSSTQDSVMPVGSPGKPYKSGANVAKGGKKSPGAGGVAPAAGPKKGKQMS